MAKFSVEWSEVKKEGETNGRKWKMVSMNLKDEKGEMHDGVTTFDVITTGQTLEGEIEIKGNYKNFKNHIQRPTAGIYNKTAAVEKAMERKEESITKFADRKEEAIAMAGAQRDAVLIVVALMKDKEWSQSVVRETITLWRNWFLSDEFKKDIPPF